MLMTEYQDRTSDTAIYPDKGEATQQAINYCVVGLCGEVGELANQWQKILRGDSAAPLEKMEEELGDCLWYLARLADEMGIPLENIARDNLDKLKDRSISNRLRGSGDDR